MAHRPPASDRAAPQRALAGPGWAAPGIDVWSPQPDSYSTLPTGRTRASISPVRRGRGQARGVACSAQLPKIGNRDVLSASPERYDAAGSRLPPVGVELHPHRGGELSDGEEVDVVGHWKDGTSQAKRIVNRTTGAGITGSGRDGRTSPWRSSPSPCSAALPSSSMG
jgi:hypothetical protein